MQNLDIVLDRRGLLRWAGAAAATGPLAAAVVPGVALGAVPKPSPQNDDAGFLAFLAVAEAVAADLYARAGKVRGFDAGELRRLRLLRQAKREAIVRVTGPLGDDAPVGGDFAAKFPAADVASRARFLALAQRLERLICGVEINGVGYAADPATRLLLGRLLAADAQALGTVRMLAGQPATTGLLAPVDLDAAGATLDAFVVSPTAPVTERIAS